MAEGEQEPANKNASPAWSRIEAAAVSSVHSLASDVGRADSVFSQNSHFTDTTMSVAADSLVDEDETDEDKKTGNEVALAKKRAEEEEEEMEGGSEDGSVRPGILTP